MSDFERFFEQHYGGVVRSLALAIGDRSRAEDSAQEAFARAFRRWRSVSLMANPVGWVYVVALNAERKEWRRQERREPMPPERADSAVSDHGEPTADALMLGEALTRLTTRQRTAVVLRYLADLSTAEVAEALGCTEGTVKATVHRALAKLRIQLNEDVDDELEVTE